ncbi:hypothetical protein QQX98_012739 [Neonectria punicea]|uniref:Mid2 domain-containing protein n=1 Tax=Neonectria punicea TaxID=979145 RepID=A0ABR1GHY2_9HYPO
MLFLAVAVGLLLAPGLSVVRGDKVITCYGYGGLAYPDNARCPGSNACCGVDATCLSNRLCHKPNDGPNTFLRGPCAVDPYDSGTCAQICLYNETTGVLPRVSVCKDGTLCCDDDDHCCDDGNGIFLGNDGKIADGAPSTTYSYGPERTAASFRTKTETPTTSSAPATSTEASTTSASLTSSGLSVSTSASAQEDNDEKDSSSNASGLAIGLGVGIPVACIGLGLIGAWFWWKNRKAKQSRAHETDTRFARDMAQYQPKWPETVVHHPGNYELSTESPPVELDGGSRRF